MDTSYYTAFVAALMVAAGKNINEYTKMLIEDDFLAFREVYGNPNYEDIARQYDMIYAQNSQLDPTMVGGGSDRYTLKIPVGLALSSVKAVLMLIWLDQIKDPSKRQRHVVLAWLSELAVIIGLSVLRVFDEFTSQVMSVFVSAAYAVILLMLQDENVPRYALNVAVVASAGMQALLFIVARDKC